MTSTNSFGTMKNLVGQRYFTTCQYLANFMEAAELFHLDFNGPHFTWRGTRNGELVEEMIDRGCVIKYGSLSGQTLELSMPWFWDRITARSLSDVSHTRRKVGNGSGLKLFGPKKRTIGG